MDCMPIKNTHVKCRFDILRGKFPEYLQGSHAPIVVEPEHGTAAWTANESLERIPQMLVEIGTNHLKHGMYIVDNTF